jgi:predicted glycoside hydrolase/deacetylase ChbG (UPF0249 family)
MHSKTLLIIIFCLFIVVTGNGQQTYAEKLGYPKNAKVLILHVDDAGMSWESNTGAIQAMEKGVANSVSVMMPCPWVPGFIRYLKEHPTVDAGLHLTLTSEWKDYRWTSLIGKSAAPGLIDDEGAMWPSVEDVVKHASAEEVDKEIRAQLARARSMGFEPTHFDSHMGTLFNSPEFTQRYIALGIETKIPVMFPGGHVSHLSKTIQANAQQIAGLQQAGLTLWNAGLPVLDDLHNVSYGFPYPKEEVSDEVVRKIATSKYIETIKELKPGLSMVIMHCSNVTPTFQFITNSGTIRKGDLLAMTDPVFKKFLQDEGIILTTWREVMKRRSAVK